MASLPFPVLTADEAAALVPHASAVGFSGFTPAGAAKIVPSALARRATALHAKGEPWRIGVLTGASTGPSLDGALAAADATAWRTPYQSNATLRKNINSGKTVYFDMHLSQIQPWLRAGFLGKIDWAIIEVCDIEPDGSVVLSTSVGATNTYARLADKVILELNAKHPAFLRGLHDIYEPADPPNRRHIPLFSVRDRIGSPLVKIDPSRIVGIVLNDAEDEVSGFDETTPVTRAIGANVAHFLAAERRAGRLPDGIPFQSGVGNIANAVIAAMAQNEEIPAFDLYSEVIQDGVINLIEQDRIPFASGTSLTVTPPVLQRIYDNWDNYKNKLVLRPQEISNSPELARRLGVIAINTALEMDIAGNVNSTHVLGRQMMNGIGGSGDFTRNAHISIFTAPSTQKDGAISTIVPFVSHTDHSEHSVQIFVTEHGVADLRGKDPTARAATIIDNCVDPQYRDLLRAYVKSCGSVHAYCNPDKAFAFHQAFAAHKDMRKAAELLL
ncbi:MAG: succinate CoA transferase [Puniceicoccales bacterium]|jgi:acetyl-CoA hydrolase|nr:succinate CoA transferase [Puniceicoccales bacterium]